MHLFRCICCLDDIRFFFRILTFVTFQGKYDEADPLYGRSLALREKALGPNHPMVAQSLTNRARLLDREVRAILFCLGGFSGSPYVE